jgi:hypothetical protein
MAIERPEAIGAASCKDRSASGGWRGPDFVAARGMSAPALRGRKSGPAIAVEAIEAEPVSGPITPFKEAGWDAGWAARMLKEAVAALGTVRPDRWTRERLRQTFRASHQTRQRRKRHRAGLQQLCCAAPPVLGQSPRPPYLRQSR